MLRRSIAISLWTVLSCALPALSMGGTLDQIRKSGEIRIGYPTDAPPMAFNDASGQAAGYSIDLCKRIATAVKDELKLADLKVTFVPLTSANRIDAIIDNKADIQCGTTTITLSRAKSVDFTLMTFVTGGTLLSLANASVESLGDMAGKSVAVVAGTTSDAALRSALTKNLVDAKVVVVKTREEAMKQLDAGQVAAFASDQIVLIGQMIQSGDPRKYALARDLYSYEPYAFVVRRDDSDFRLVVDRALAQIYRSNQIQQIYNQWFSQVGIKASPVLAAMYSIQSLPE